MKILHVINNLGLGGAQKLIVDVLPLLNADSDMEVELLLLNDEGNVFGNNIHNSEVRVTILSTKKLKNPINIMYLKKYFQHGNYDIIHAHLFPTLYWVSLASKLMLRTNTRFVYTEHSSHNKRRNIWGLRYLERFIYSSYKKIISISSTVRENLMTWLNINTNSVSKYVLINNGIDTKKFSEAIPYEKRLIDKSLNDDSKLLCMIGRFDEAKDQVTVIKAMKKLDLKIKLLLVGEGPLIDFNKDLAKEYGVEDRVHFLGFRSDIERIIKTCDIVIISSNWEGFGLAAVEGMAAGKPVIATNVPGLNEIVDGAAILFKNKDVSGLADKIVEVLESNELYLNVASRCSKRAKKYSLKYMAKSYKKLYQSIVED